VAPLDYLLRALDLSSFSPLFLSQLKTLIPHLIVAKDRYITSTSLGEKFEQLLKANAEKDAQLEYLRRQLDQAMRINRKEIQSSHSTSGTGSAEEDTNNNPLASSDEDEERRPRRTRRDKQPYMDFKVEIPEFEGRLDPDEFLEWINTAERVFKYKEVPDDKKVKLIALKLCEMLPFGGEMLLLKGLEKGRGKLDVGGK